MLTWHQRNKALLAAYRKNYYRTHEEYRLRKIQQAKERYRRLQGEKTGEPR